MFNNLIQRLKNEYKHYLSLSAVVRRLLYSYVFYLVSYPIMGLFINVYFWRQSNDITLIAAYNLGFFLFLPIGFYLNGLLLSRVNILKLYWVGVFTQGFAAALAIFFPNLSFDIVLFYGAIYGLGGGLYWANKNYITLKLTKNTNRLYYNALETSIELVSGILLPVLVGWGIVFGEKLELYSVDTAYKVLILIALILLWLSGYMLQKADIYSEKITHLLPHNPSSNWYRNRLISALYYVVAGANYFIPTILTLLLIGLEGELGTLESLSAILTAILMYWIGRKTKLSRSSKIYVVAGVLYLAASLLLTYFYNLASVLFYIATSSISLSICWNLIYANSMEIMDKEQDLNPGSNQYALVMDNEIYYNLGRIIGMAILFEGSAVLGQRTALVITPIILSLLLLSIIIPLNKNLKFTSASNKDGH